MPHFTLNTPYSTSQPLHTFHAPFAYSLSFNTSPLKSVSLHVYYLSLTGIRLVHAFLFQGADDCEAEKPQNDASLGQLNWGNFIEVRAVGDATNADTSSPSHWIHHHNLLIIFQKEVLFLKVNIPHQNQIIGDVASAPDQSSCTTIGANLWDKNKVSALWHLFELDYGEMTSVAMVDASTRALASQVDGKMTSNEVKSGSSHQRTPLATQCIIGTSNGYLILLDLIKAFDAYSPQVQVSQISSLDFLQQSKISIGVQSLLYDSSMDILIILLAGSGTIAVCRMTPAQFDKEQYDFAKLMTLSGGIVALSSQSQLLAVGLINGDIKLYDYCGHQLDEMGVGSDNDIKDQSEQGVFRLRGILSLRERGGYLHSQLFIGKPQSLAFSHDGAAIAASYQGSGLAIFDSSGVCLMSSVDPTPDQKWPQQNHDTDASPINVKGFYWDVEDTRLLALCEDCAVIYEVVKSAQLTNMSEPFQNAVILQGVDRMMIFRLTTEGFFKTHWEHLMFHDEYVRHNYPIKHVATSRDGQNIVVAGRHGCTVYNEHSRKWRLFGNHHQEKLISCCAITWITNDIICLVDYNKKGSTLVLYPRFHLDNSSLIGQLFVCDNRVIHASYDKGLLFLYDDQCCLHAIQIDIQQVAGRGRMAQYKSNIDILASVDMRTGCNHIFPAKAMMTLKHHTKSNVHDRTCLFLHQDRRLTAFYVNYSQEVLLESDVDNFWIETETEKELIYFVYSHGRGVHLCIQDVAFLDRPTKQRCTIYFDSLIEYDVDKCPMGILQEYGTFVHASMAVSQQIDKEVFDVQAHAYPYAHVIVLYKLICQQNPLEALDYANQYVEKSSFEAILDWLLFFVLSDQKIWVHFNGAVHEIQVMDHLPAVVSFLKKYDSQFYISVVNCLRKVDFRSRGERLLRATGIDSTDILTACLNRNLISSAVNMLRIVQQEHSLETSLSCAYSLVKPLLQSEKYELLYELVVFINKMEYEITASKSSSPVDSRDAQLSDEANQKLRIETTYRAFIPDWLGDNVQIQMMVSKHFAKILSTGHLSSLLQASTNLMTPMNTWLAHQKNHPSFIEIHSRWIHYFAQIHHSFGLPRCPNITRGFMFSSPHEIEKNDHFVFFTVTQDRLFALFHLKEEITTLWKLFDDASCVDWSILLATLLCDVDYILAQLWRHPHLWAPYEALLDHPHNVGYKRLMDYLSRMRMNHV